MKKKQKKLLLIIIPILIPAVALAFQMFSKTDEHLGNISDYLGDISEAAEVLVENLKNQTDLEEQDVIIKSEVLKAFDSSEYEEYIKYHDDDDHYNAAESLRKLVNIDMSYGCKAVISCQQAIAYQISGMSKTAFLCIENCIKYAEIAIESEVEIEQALVVYLDIETLRGQVYGIKALFGRDLGLADAQELINWATISIDCLEVANKDNNRLLFYLYRARADILFNLLTPVYTDIESITQENFDILEPQLSAIAIDCDKAIDYGIISYGGINDSVGAIYRLRLAVYGWLSEIGDHVGLPDSQKLIDWTTIALESSKYTDAPPGDLLMLRLYYLRGRSLTDKLLLNLKDGFEQASTDSIKDWQNELNEIESDLEKAYTHGVAYEGENGGCVQNIKALQSLLEEWDVNLRNEVE